MMYDLFESVAYTVQSTFRVTFMHTFKYTVYMLFFMEWNNNKLFVL